MSIDLPREPGEDVVQWRNRCLLASGRTDIEWYWAAPESPRLRHTHRVRQSKLDLGDF